MLIHRRFLRTRRWESVRHYSWLWCSHVRPRRQSLRSIQRRSRACPQNDSHPERAEETNCWTSRNPTLPGCQASVGGANGRATSYLLHRQRCSQIRAHQRFPPPTPDSAWLSAMYWGRGATVGSYSWFERVPSPSNVADAPSRGVPPITLRGTSGFELKPTEVNLHQGFERNARTRFNMRASLERHGGN